MNTEEKEEWNSSANQIIPENVQELSDEQVEEYNYLLHQLGAFPDKVQINVLTMIADDFSAAHQKSSSSRIYQSIRALLISSDVTPDRKLPLVYVMDSILKNVRGIYISLMQDDIAQWMPIVYDSLSTSSQYDVAKTKLRKVWDTWKGFHLFPEPVWKEMGKSFFKEDERIKTAKLLADAKAKAVGIARASDGTLIVSSTLRKQMQSVLDEIQGAENVDELNKVSLERLAEINPDLLLEIKKAAEEILSMNEKSTSGGEYSDTQYNPMRAATNPIFIDIRPMHVLERIADWDKVQVDPVDKSREIITKLNSFVRVATTTTTTNIATLSHSETQHSEDRDWCRNYNLNLNNLIASCSAAANLLTVMQEKIRSNASLLSSSTSTTTTASMNPSGYPPTTNKLPFTQQKAFLYRSIDTNMFSSEGIKERNDGVIARLYQVGLPFVCSADGRRFATQVELSKHLDWVFKKRQLEKTMERSEERAWYPSIVTWMGPQVSGSSMTSQGQTSSHLATYDSGQKGDGTMGALDQDNMNPLLSTVTADESRDRCVLCGINFTMHFDQEEGEWKYRNCREIEVITSDAEIDSNSNLMLVHVSCLRGLGSPDTLYIDQILQSK